MTYENIAGTYDTVLASNSKHGVQLIARLSIGGGWSVLFYVAQNGKEMEFGSLAAACRAYDRTAGNE